MNERALAAVCGVALGSAIVSQLLGLHYVFGAFIAGAVMPANCATSFSTACNWW